MEELRCAECGFGNDPDHRYCRRCGAEIDSDSDAVDQVIELGEADQVIEDKAAPVNPIGCGVDILGTVLLIFAAVILFVVMAAPNFGRGNRGPARQKHCFANMRVLTGAIEMYNMDHTEAIRRFDPTVLPLLISGNYLRSSVDCPGGASAKPGIYLSEGDLSVNGHIYCTVHGSLENPAPPDR